MSRDVTSLNQALIYLEVLRKIPRHSSVDARDIQQALANIGIDLPILTLQRYLKALVDSGIVPIDCNRNSKPYSYRISTEETPLLLTDPSPQESLLIHMAQEQLRYQLPSHLTKAFDTMFESANSALKSTAKAHKEKAWLKKVAVVNNTLPQIPPPIKPRLFDAISNGLFENKKLELTYSNMKRETKTATVSPLGLVQQGVRLYLVCQFDGYDNIRHLALHRIKDVKVLVDNAQVIPDFNVREYANSIHFNYVGDERTMVHLVLEFTNPQTALNLTEAPFNRTQKIEELEDGYRLDVDIEDSLLLDGWIKTWEEIAGIRKVEKTKI